MDMYVKFWFYKVYIFVQNLASYWSIFHNESNGTLFAFFRFYLKPQSVFPISVKKREKKTKGAADRAAQRPLQPTRSSIHFFCSLFILRPNLLAHLVPGTEAWPVRARALLLHLPFLLSLILSNVSCRLQHENYPNSIRCLGTLVSYSVLTRLVRRIVFGRGGLSGATVQGWDTAISSSSPIPLFGFEIPIPLLRSAPQPPPPQISTRRSSSPAATSPTRIPGRGFLVVLVVSLEFLRGGAARIFLRGSWIPPSEAGVFLRCRGSSIQRFSGGAEVCWRGFEAEFVPWPRESPL
jgi:hypothetical protein